MKLFAVIGLLLLLACPAGAEQSNFIYTKTVLKIIPNAASMVQEPSPALMKNPAKAIDKGAADPVPDAQSMMPVLKRTPKEFTVEVRSPSFLAQKDFIEHQPFTDREGLLIEVNPPAEASLSGTRMIASADVLFVDADGVIIKIAPELKLATLTETIPSGRPIRAFVYLKAGTARIDDIQLGDRVENGYFKTHPVVIQ